MHIRPTEYLRVTVLQSPNIMQILILGAKRSRRRDRSLFDPCVVPIPRAPWAECFRQPRPCTSPLQGWGLPQQRSNHLHGKQHHL